MTKTKIKSKPRFKSAYSPSRRVFANNKGSDGEKMPSRTVQSSKDECDINTIMQRYKQVGLIEHVNTAKAHYGDFTEVNEFQEALNLVNTANEDFMKLPADIRSLFDNDAGKFLEFATNPKNIDEMVELGLAKKPKAVTQPAVSAEAEAPTKQAGEASENAS